jgi:hypothetical protein
MIRRHHSLIAVLTAALVAVACGDGSPTTPSETAKLTGRWTGTYRVTSCNGGNEACQDSALKSSYPVVLVLNQDERGLIVTGSAGSRTSIVADVPVGISNGQLTSNPMPATGSFDSSTRTLQIEASQAFNRGDSAGGFQAGIVFSRWNTVVGPSGTTMTGTFQVAVTFERNNAFPSMWTSQAEFISLTKQP